MHPNRVRVALQVAAPFVIIGLGLSSLAIMQGNSDLLAIGMPLVAAPLALVWMVLRSR